MALHTVPEPLPPEGAELLSGAVIRSSKGVIGDAEKIQTGITASTTQTQGQQLLTGEVNEIDTVANANDVVTAPPAAASTKPIRVINNGANTLQIFPSPANDLGAGVDTAVTLVAGATVSFIYFDSVTGVPV